MNFRRQEDNIYKQEKHKYNVVPLAKLTDVRQLDERGH